LSDPIPLHGPSSYSSAIFAKVPVPKEDVGYENERDGDQEESADSKKEVAVKIPQEQTTDKMPLSLAVRSRTRLGC